MIKNNLKHRLRNGEVLIGTWISIGSPEIAEIMANAGFDWIVVDLEHSVISIESAANLIRVINLCGSSALVRLTSNNPDQIKRMMDAGADGIILPMVKSENDVRAALSAMKYEPEGSRGVGLARAQGYGSSFDEYLLWQKKNSILIIQIEHMDAVQELEKILSVEGVDGFIIGPYDLSCSMSIPGKFETSKFKSTISYILKTGKKLGVPTGIHIVEPDKKMLQHCVQEGYQFIAYGVDIRILDVVARGGIQIFKEIVL